VSVADIDYVMCTHLHVDHVGWNTRLENGRWVPTFPKAKYLFADRELAFWTEREKEDATRCPWVTDSVLPIVEAKRAELVKSDHMLNDLVQLIPKPARSVRQALRQRNSALHGAFPVAVHRARQALGRRVQDRGYLGPARLDFGRYKTHLVVIFSQRRTPMVKFGEEIQ
jgi:hypothetical protein